MRHRAHIEMPPRGEKGLDRYTHTQREGENDTNEFLHDEAAAEDAGIFVENGDALATRIPGDSRRSLYLLYWHTNETRTLLSPDVDTLAAAHDREARTAWIPSHAFDTTSMNEYGHKASRRCRPQPHRSRSLVGDRRDECTISTPFHEPYSRRCASSSRRC